MCTPYIFVVSFLEMSSAEIQQGTSREDKYHSFNNYITSPHSCTSPRPVPDNHKGMNFEHLPTERFVFFKDAVWFQGCVHYS